MAELKGFLNGELQSLGIDLKGLKQELRTLNFRLSKMKGN